MVDFGLVAALYFIRLCVLKSTVSDLENDYNCDEEFWNLDENKIWIVKIMRSRLDTRIILYGEKHT